MTDTIPASEIEAIRANNKRDLDMYDGDLKPVPRQITECATLLRKNDQNQYAIQRLNDKVDAMAEENARLREALTWKPITSALESGGPYLVTNNLNATLNDGSMSHVFLTRMIHQNGDEFSAYTDELRKVHKLSHFLPVTRTALKEPGQ
jgi:hypothetical protein